MEYFLIESQTDIEISKEVNFTWINQIKEEQVKVIDPLIVSLDHIGCDRTDDDDNVSSCCCCCCEPCDLK
jgi:hypothetical protein